MGKNLLIYLGEAFEQYRVERRAEREVQRSSRPARRFLRWLTPNGGTVLLVIMLIATARVWAKPLADTTDSLDFSATTINYQGHLADSEGNPLTEQGVAVSFAIYDAAVGGNLIWPASGREDHIVDVTDGLFSVGLGSGTTGGIPTTTWNGDRYLEITVDGETLSPRELIRSVPIAGMALTVPDQSITPEKLVRGETSYWADYRSYIRFLKDEGVTDSDLCPEGGVAVGVTGPVQSLELKTGNDIANATYAGSGTCLNVHSVAPCGSIIGDYYPYEPESCSEDFSGEWAPFYWWDGDTSHEVTHNILGEGIGCYSVYYACVVP